VNQAAEEVLHATDAAQALLRLQEGFCTLLRLPLRASVPQHKRTQRVLQWRCIALKED
jgi:hypothetical protein